MKRIVCALLLSLAGSVLAQAVPSWATGRDGNGNLQVNGGTAGTITFKSENYQGDPNVEFANVCPPFDRVDYDQLRDGYEGRSSPACRTVGACPNFLNRDIYQPAWDTNPIRHVLMKNLTMKNAFRIDYVRDDPHVDVSQVLNSPHYGGWFVIQDSVFQNSDNGLTQWQFGAGTRYTTDCGTYEGKGVSNVAGVVVQGFTLRLTSEFSADCSARAAIYGDIQCSNSNYWGPWPNSDGSKPPLWVINMTTDGWYVILQQSWQKVIIVGALPNISDAGQPPNYLFSVAQPCTGSPCSSNNNFWGPYANIEAALAAGHAEPPFIRLSCSGWANTANCTPGAGSAPSAPANFRTTWLSPWQWKEYR